MKKSSLVVMVLALVLGVAGCDLYGTIKKVTIKYTMADYVNHRMVKHAVTGLGTETHNNAFVNISAGGPDSHFEIQNSSLGYPINSDSAGIWVTNIQGYVVDPSEFVLDNAFATNAMCQGVARVSGTGNYIPASSSFTGDGQFIFFPFGSMDIVGTGKYNTIGAYTGVAKVTITPGIALLFSVSGGSVTGTPAPVEAVISIPAIALTN